MSNSDYTKPRTNLVNLLPDVLKTKVNKSILENVHNRYLTKTELIPTFGSVGKRNPSVAQDNRLVEPTVHRQAWQLQPLLYSKIATVEHISSYHDILQAAERLGIDLSRLPKWGNALKFNFAPPISIDKLVNYQDYYWYDPINRNSSPQYITISNACAVADNRRSHLEAELDRVTRDPTSTPEEIAAVQQSVDAAIIQRDCLCSGGGIGWDRTGWDDSGQDWWLGLPTAPDNTPPNTGDTFVYYDVPTSTVKVWSATDNSWIDAATPLGIFPWDSAEACITQSDPWSSENKWIHKSAINDSLGGLVRRAEMPIIEYNSFLELNEWVYVTHQWKYKADDVTDWVNSDTTPTDLEMVVRYDITIVDNINNEIYVAGDMTSTFVPNFVFAIEDPSIPSATNTLWTVIISGFDSINNRTAIKLVESVAPINTTYKIIPTSITSRGDQWKGFFYHWSYVGASQPIPTNNQYVNPNVVYSETLSTVSNSTMFITPAEFLNGADVIRVYVEGIRQYGTYVEGWYDSVTATFTEGVGVDGVHSNAIRFFDSIAVPAMVRIETSPAALSDINHAEVLARTDTNTPFTPEVVTLINYRRVEQVKTETNQYPLFNIFNVDGTPAFRANSIFAFQEGASYPVDLRIGKRIISSNSGKEYYFEQFLIDEDNGRLYCYKDISSVEVTNPEGLQTIWRKGLNNEEYVPRYVNQYRLAEGDEYLDSSNTIQTTHIYPGVSDNYTTSGDWEVADQLYYNANHENRKKFRLTDLVAHFNTIINAQQPDSTMAFLQDQNAIIGTLQEYNFGVGGSIKEFNDSYDMFLSAMYQDTNNPLTIMNFASAQYANNLTYLQETFIAHAVDYLKRGESFSELQYIWDQGAYIADDIITMFELNDAYDFVFGDSTVYDPNNTVDSQGNKIGIKNWIATLPFLKLARAVEPQKLVDAALGINKIRHHDGHVTDVVVDNRTVANITNQLLVETNGGSGTAFPTANLYRGMYFKRTDTDKLYRFNVVDIAPSPPGIINPIGSFWLNTNTDTLYIRDTSITGWSIYSGSPEDAWKEINITDIIIDIIFEAEQRLYRAVPLFTDFAFDYTTLAPAGDVDEQTTFVNYLKQAYFDFIQQHQLNPYATDYSAVDAFTWNYGGIDPTTIPAVRYPTTSSGIAKPWGSRWNVIYKEIFGTAYPHIEPWVLQGYTEQPTWWDEVYKNPNGTRRWLPAMWTNIAAGVIPAGKTPPAGTVPQYTHFCVNIYNTTIDGYAPDELIPPYYSNDATLKQQAILNDVSWLTTLTTKINPTDIVNNSPYGFGDQGPVEQMWRESVEFVYDIIKVAFKMQPVRFLHYTMGFDFYDVAGLQVEKTSGKVLSHADMIFHGDLINDQIYQSPGFSQWYTNFVRYGAYDINTSDFKTKWTAWMPTLAYQTGSFINARSLQLASKYFPVTKQDYVVTTKKTPGYEDYWLDSLFVTTNKVGSWITFNNTKIPSAAGNDWEYRIEIASPVGRNLSCYNVKNYQFTVDTNTNICTTSVGLPWNDPSATYTPNQAETNTWVTGTAVFISSTIANPGGINDERVYFIIKLSNNTFKLADSLTNAEEGIAINLTTAGLGDLFVGEVQQHFVVSNGAITNVTWAHYKLDKRVANTIQTPYIVTGVQTLIDFIDGYAAFYADQGFVFNANDEITEIDVDTGKPLNWSVEIERLITRIYTGLGNVNNIISYEQPGGGPYTAGGSSTWITRQNNIAAYHEVNPFRNNVWFNNKIGVVSDIVSGPFDVASSVPLIYDAAGKGTTPDKVFIYREDSQCQITLASLSGSVYDGENTQPRPYSDSHMSGVHIFVDTYEHIVLFNSYTIDGNLLYDPFIGLNVNKLSVEFEKHTHQTFRPNVGGYFLDNNQLVQNIEYSIENMKYYYDTYIVNETADYLNYARSLLGYEDPTYLDQINIGSKSKFVFWKGMLQHKGSVNSINAFINSRLFVDAKIDEFWAYKIAEYGNIDPPYYPEVVLKTDDVFKNELRLHFTTSYDDLEQTFKAITFEDETRWVNLPDLKAQLGVYRNQRYGWDLPVWDTLTGVEWDSSFPGVENLFFDAEYTDRTEIIPVDEYIRLDTPFDSVSIVVDNGTETMSLSGFNAIVPITLPGFAYIPGINNLDVYFEGVKLEPTIGYVEVNPSTVQLTGTGVGEVKIIKRPGRLIEHVNYEIVNGHVIHLLPITSLVEYGTLTVYTINPAKQLQNAGRLIDAKARSVITELPIWDPVRGHHYHNAINVVDLQNDVDMAIYSTAQDDVIDANHAWNSQQVGKIWMDTKNMQYVPYYDTIIFPDINDRVTFWGKLADWSDTNLYEWTESDVIPTQWDDLVTAQSTDATIPQNEKLTGTPRRVLYKRTRPTINDDWSAWSVLNNPVKTVYGYIDNSTTYTLDTSFTGVDGGKIGVYVNGLYLGDATVSNPLGNSPSVDISSLVPTVHDYDTVTVIEQLHVPAEESSVDTLSTSTDLVEYIYDTPYSQVDTINNVGVVTSTKYYFWVKNKTNVTNDRLYSLRDAFAQLVSPDVAYMFFQHFIAATESMPNHYAQVVVRGIADRITADDRFKIRFTKDYSMRDEVSIKDSTFARKNVHREWAIFREKQESPVPRELWNKVTEAATGHPLIKVDDTHYTMDTTALIPSLERAHYDQMHGTVTRIGLGVDQAFSDKEMTINTVLEEIQNPNYDLYPISRETFFATYSFDTDENIKLAMDYIYNSFPYQHINRIFFSVMYDALSLQAEYADLFKTSTIALHGVRLFETADRVIDD